MTISEDMQEDRPSSGFFNYLPTIFWQRRWLVVPPLILLSAAGVIAAIMLPTTYRSTATLLVQSQQIPTSIVDAPANAAIDQRIAKIRQQVLSRGDLIELIERNDLYNEERRSRPLSEIVDRMRTATSINAVAGDIGQGGQSNTVAFQMGFDYRNPYKAQAVMQSFVERVLDIDTENTADRATGTVSFLKEQTTQLQRQVAEIEGRITAIKASNGLALSGAGLLTSADSGGYDAQIVALQNQNRALQLQAKRAAKDPIITAAENQLDMARATYAEDHPDVVLAKQRLAELKQRTESAGAADRTSEADTIRAQINANNATIASLGSARSTTMARASSGISAQSRAPVIMEQVSQLDSRANALRGQYQEAAEKLLNAQNSARLAQEQKGERLSVIDPPAVPDKPISPNRPLLIAGGVIAGLGLGLVLALLVELVLRPVRGVGMIEDLGIAPLGVVPTLKPDERDGEPRRRFALRRRNDSAAQPG